MNEIVLAIMWAILGCIMLELWKEGWSTTKWGLFLEKKLSRVLCRLLVFLFGPISFALLVVGDVIILIVAGVVHVVCGFIEMFTGDASD